MVRAGATAPVNRKPGPKPRQEGSQKMKTMKRQPKPAGSRKGRFVSGYRTVYIDDHNHTAVTGEFIAGTDDEAIGSAERSGLNLLRLDRWNGTKGRYDTVARWDANGQIIDGGMQS